MERNYKTTLADIEAGDFVIIHIGHGTLKMVDVTSVSARYLVADGIEFSRSTALERGVKGMTARRVYAPLEIVQLRPVEMTQLDRLLQQQKEKRLEREALIAFIQNANLSAMSTAVLRAAATALGYEKA